LHRIRDVTFGEDACTARTGTRPHVMAAIRNLVISILRLAGAAGGRPAPGRGGQRTLRVTGPPGRAAGGCPAAAGGGGNGQHHRPGAGR
jgi:hypothetical protein